MLQGLSGGTYFEVGGGDGGGGVGEGRTAEDKLGRDLVGNIFYNDCKGDDGGLVVMMMVVVVMTMMFFSFTQLALTLRLHIFECI